MANEHPDDELSRLGNSGVPPGVHTSLPSVQLDFFGGKHSREIAADRAPPAGPAQGVIAAGTLHAREVEAPVLLHAEPTVPAAPTPQAAREQIYPEPNNAAETHAIASWLVRTRRAFEADELVMRTARRLPRDLAVQVMALETALDIGRIEEAGEIYSRARLLPTGRVHPKMRALLVDLGIRLVGLRAKQRCRSPAKTSSERARRTATTKAPPALSAEPSRPAPPPSVPTPTLALRFGPLEIDLGADEPFDAATRLADYRLRLRALEVLDLSSFETLLALGQVRGVDRYEYQMRTVQRVLREFYGRVLLADEVGLGKTVEACLCLKEYLLRGLVKNALILVPPALRQQWRDELESKFGIHATIVSGEEARDRPDIWRDPGVLIASLGLARLEQHSNQIAQGSFDLVIVDEAHRLKNRGTRSWQLVDRLRSRFLLLLSATPVENDLIEIYNMITLLKPGVFSTEAEFRRAFVGPGGGRTVKDPERLRTILRQAMIRNTRALAEAKLPPRFAATLRAAPGEEERAWYADLGQAVRAGLNEKRLTRAAATEVLRAAGSAPVAAATVVRAWVSAELAERAAAIAAPAKDALLLDLFARRKDEKILLFTGHLVNLKHLATLARKAGRRPALFHGSLSPAEKESAIGAFAADHDVLVSSESGGEGFNLQFARTLVNYDLPWNPMRIEQRIGRVHRIGQPREVYIFNLVTAGTLEEEVLRVLDEKLNMFELVVGEIEAVLGRLGDDELEFQELVLDLYAGSGDALELRARFDELGERMLAARTDYEGVKRFEAAAFGRDLEV